MRVRGMLFVYSKYRRIYSFVVRGFFNTPIVEKSEEIFGVENAREIEVAFEQGAGWYSYHDLEDFEDAGDFGKYFKDDKARLAAIMQNIIDHDGHFIPGTNGKNAKKYKRTF